MLLEDSSAERERQSAVDGEERSALTDCPGASDDGVLPGFGQEKNLEVVGEGARVGEDEVPCTGSPSSSAVA